MTTQDDAQAITPTTTDPQVSIPQDTPTTRAMLEQMDDQQHETMLLQIRERRLRLQILYEQQLTAKRLQAIDKLDTQINKQLDMLTKEVERCNTTLEKAEDRVNKIRALRLQRGDLVEQQSTQHALQEEDDEA